MIVGIRWMVCEELLVIASEWGGGGCILAEERI